MTPPFSARRPGCLRAGQRGRPNEHTSSQQLSLKADALILDPLPPFMPLRLPRERGMSRGEGEELMHFSEEKKKKKKTDQSGGDG